jgi:arylsulfatase A-like enzyme
MPHRARAALINGALLLLLLFGFRLETVVALQLELGAVDWALSFLPDVGTVVVIESLFVLAARAPAPAAAALWRTAFVPVHFVLYAIALIEHQFFLHTGTHVDAGLVVYTLGNLSSLWGLLGTGLDLGLLPRVAAAALCFGLGWRECRSAGEPSAALSTAAPALLLCGSLGVVAVAPELEGAAASLSSGVFLDFLRGGSGDSQRSSAWLAAHVEPAYERPTLAGSDVARRPDIVLLILESMRADAVSVDAGAQGPGATPFLARFAQDALVYESVYTTVPHTSKALIGILCGMYPVLVMSIVESVPGQLPLECAPHLLRKLGYRTAFMQTALGEFENRPGLAGNLGFEEWTVQEDLGTDFERTGYFGMDEFAMLEPALDWFERNADQPRFLTLLTVTTHHPYHVPGAPEPDEERPYEHYQAAVGHVDRFAGELYDRLRERGALENALFIVVGDHGEAFAEHLRRQHDVVPYEEGIRVPLMIQGPEWLGAPRRIAGLRSHIDLLPTLLEVLGARWSGRLPGRSLLSTKGHDAVLASCWYDNYCLALRSGKLKYVFHYGRRPAEVFDLGADPGELRDLSASMPDALREAVERRMLPYRFSMDAYYRAHAPRRRPADRGPAPETPAGARAAPPPGAAGSRAGGP